MSSTLDVHMVMTGHSLGRNKLEHLLASGGHCQGLPGDGCKQASSRGMQPGAGLLPVEPSSAGLQWAPLPGVAGCAFWQHLNRVRLGGGSVAALCWIA